MDLGGVVEDGNQCVHTCIALSSGSLWEGERTCMHI